jgi:hypothetical protein
MTTDTAKLLKEIEGKLVQIAGSVKMSNSVGKMDINIDMERLFKKILNALYSLDLIDLNVKISNYPAIDLGDEDSQICFQVTSTNTSVKIKDTIATFKRHNLDKIYNKLSFLVLTYDDPCNAEDKDKVNKIETSAVSLSGLYKNIHGLENEGLIRRIHRLMQEFNLTLPINSDFPEEPELQYYVGSIQRLINQIGLKEKTEQKEITQLGNEMDEFGKLLSSLTAEQRYVLFKIVHKSKLDPSYHEVLYITSTTAQIEFTAQENWVITSLIDRDLIWVDNEWSVGSDSRVITVLRLSGLSKLSLNIFAELKVFCEGDKDLLREMLVSRDFKCLEL